MENPFKMRMSDQEMEAAYLAYHPCFVANKNCIGRFAKRFGYIRGKQMVNGKLEKFYYRTRVM